MKLELKHLIYSCYENLYSTYYLENDCLRQTEGSDIEKLAKTLRSLDNMVTDMIMDGDFDEVLKHIDEVKNQELLITTLYDMRSLALVLADEAENCENDARGLSTLLKGSSKQIMALFGQIDDLENENKKLNAENEKLAQEKARAEAKLDEIRAYIEKLEKQYSRK